MDGSQRLNQSKHVCWKKMESPPQPELFRFQPFRQAPILGVIRLDYDYAPTAGDIDCPGSFDYDAGLGEFYSPAWVNHVLTGEMRAPGYISGVRSHWRNSPM